MAGGNPQAIELTADVASLVDAGQLTDERTIASIRDAVVAGAKTMPELRQEMAKQGFRSTATIQREARAILALPSRR